MTKAFIDPRLCPFFAKVMKNAIFEGLCIDLKKLCYLLIFIVFKFKKILCEVSAKKYKKKKKINIFNNNNPALLRQFKLIVQIVL